MLSGENQLYTKQYGKLAHLNFDAMEDGAAEVWSRRIFIMNTISLQGIGTVGLISDRAAPIPYGESYS